MTINCSVFRIINGAAVFTMLLALILPAMAAGSACKETLPNYDGELSFVHVYKPGETYTVLKGKEYCANSIDFALDFDPKDWDYKNGDRDGSHMFFFTAKKTDADASMALCKGKFTIIAC
jgi:hypothetical protein